MEQLIQLLRLDEPDLDGNIYPQAVVNSAVQKFEERIQKYNGVMGECSIPNDLQMAQNPDVRFVSIDLGRVSHIVRHVWIENKTLMCKIKLLGKYAQLAELMDVEFLAVPRAGGEMDGVKGRLVCTNYSLVTVDLVLPSMV